MMTSQQRFLSIMNFDKSCRVLQWELGYWAGTVRRWYREGLTMNQGIPDDLENSGMVYGELLPWPPDEHLKRFPKDHEVSSYFHFDEGFENVQVNCWFWPPFEDRTLESHDGVVVQVDDMGITREIRKDSDCGTLETSPRYLEWPVKNREDFEKIKEKFRPTLGDRVPSNWSELVEKYKGRKAPLALGGHPCGFFGSLRYLMGFENLCIAYYEEPQLIKDIVDFLAEFWVDLWHKVVSRIYVDCVHFWEDMSGIRGSLISPQLFREFMIPPYKKLIQSLKRDGIKNFLVDTDGDCTELIPLFLECGVTGMYPFESKALDLIRVRKNFPTLQILGGMGLDKVLAGKTEIDRELARIRFLLKEGGYIPCTDNLVLPDISWENFKHYREELDRLIEK